MTYKLGVDGGGTKTESILVDESGAIIARHIGPGCNPSVVGPDHAKKAVADSLRTLLTPWVVQDPDLAIGTTLLCMAGSRSFWQEFAASLMTFGRVVAVDDSLPVLELAAGGNPGLVLHAGTGSFVAARAAPDGPIAAATPFGIVHYAGGLGWRFGDPGSGYDIGRRAAIRASLELQGWLPHSAVGKLVLDQTGTTEAVAISRYFYSDRAANSRIAELAPGMLALAKDDPVAREIVLGSAFELLDLAHLVAAKLFTDVLPSSYRAGLSGPILTQPLVAAALTERSRIALVPVPESPAEGVRRLLLRL